MQVGWVSDEMHMALADVQFEFTQGDAVVECRSSASGAVRAQLSPGTWRCVLTKPGYGRKTVDLEVTPGGEHTCPELLKEAVYGLPELFAAEIAKARLVANPGCYPTGAILAVAPLLAGGLVEPDGLIFDAYSGLSGAGRTYNPKSDNLFVACNENLRAYGVGTHKHTPEIERGVESLAGRKVPVTFVPHLAPMTFGIHTTAFCRPADWKTLDTAALLAAARKFFAPHPFVRVFDEVAEVATANVRASNYCDWSAKFVENSGMVVVTTAIDNTVKGAAGQAVENMNIMFGIDRRAGLTGRSL